MRSLLLLSGLLLIAGPAFAGVDCTVVAAEDLALPGTHGGLEVDFTSRAGVAIRLAIDATASGIRNPSFTGELHPVDPAAVHAALQELRGWDGPALRATVYCLPGYPLAIGRSFAVGAEIFLAPGFGPIEPEVVAYTVVHELGHVLQNSRFPGRIGRDWESYLRLRGLEDAQVHSDAAVHRDRPGEIFAEDFRALFGGPLATYSGTIENPELTRPGDVWGLDGFFLALLAQPVAARGPQVAVSNHPNPFNPETTITVALAATVVAAATAVSIDVFDLRGRHVRSLGVQPATEWIEVRWDGIDDAGRAVASGRYLCRVVAGATLAQRSLLLIK